jgi:superfamily II DNA or RNA helicase
VSRNQGVFNEIYGNQAFGPRGIEPRDWQAECQADYMASVSDHESTVAGLETWLQHRFTLFAGTGSGKTMGSALIACNMLNSGRARMLVVVCPNRAILRKTRKDFMAKFGIELVPYNARKHADGIPRGKQGYILTYAHMIQNPTRHRELCASDPTMVILDEFHHLGEQKTWGDAVAEAFERCPYVLSMSGTPYRLDNNPIPFVLYDPPDATGIRRLKADFSYTLARAVREKVCRTPQFVWHSGTVSVRPDPNGPEIITSFDQEVSNELSRLRLRGAVAYGSQCRRRMLDAALSRCREERRKVIIFLGGDTAGEQLPTEDATSLMPSELAELGITPAEFDVVTGEDKEAQRKIDEFGASLTKWVLISINMVSEGVDIPEISAAIFLSSVCAKLTLVQRIGRTLRLMGEDDPHKVALIFMLRSPEFVDLSDEIEAEIAHEIELKKERAVAEGAGAGGGERPTSRAEAIGIAGGDIVSVKLNGQEWPIQVFNQAAALLRSRGMSASLMEVAMYLIIKGNADVDGRAG